MSLRLWISTSLLIEYHILETGGWRQDSLHTAGKTDTTGSTNKPIGVVQPGRASRVETEVLARPVVTGTVPRARRIKKMQQRTSVGHGLQRQAHFASFLLNSPKATAS